LDLTDRKESEGDGGVSGMIFDSKVKADELASFIGSDLSLFVSSVTFFFLRNMLITHYDYSNSQIFN
jgi:hypothetical protein